MRLQFHSHKASLGSHNLQLIWLKRDTDNLAHWSRSWRVENTVELISSYYHSAATEDSSSADRSNQLMISETK